MWKIEGEKRAGKDRVKREGDRGAGEWERDTERHRERARTESEGENWVNCKKGQPIIAVKYSSDVVMCRSQLHVGALNMGV